MPPRGALTQAMGPLYVSVMLRALLLFMGSVLFCACKSELSAPCDSLTLAELTADCRTKVRSSCARDAGVVDESCPALQACDARIKQWLACSDGGTP